MRSKVLIIVLALGIGGMAAVLAANYLRGAQADIAKQNRSVEVLVAEQDLPRGLSATELIEKKLVSKKKVPAQFVAADAVSSERILEDRVLSTPVSAGEQLTRSRFQFPASAGLSYTVPEGYVAITVAVDEVKGVAGLLKPEDNVIVFTSFEPKGKESAFTKPAVIKARVLAVGPSTTSEVAETPKKEGSVLAGNTDQGQDGSNAEYQSVTLAVKTDVAQGLVFAQEFGSLQLALMPRNAEEPSPPAPVSFKQVAPAGLLRK